MHSMTASNLRSAYGGESMAHMRYVIWGDKARRDGLANVARLFMAIAAAEQIHASNHFRELRAEAQDFLVASMAVFGLLESSDNLQGGIDGETYEVDEMYPAYLEEARFQGEKGAQLSFNYALSAEKTHAALFRKAKKAVDAGKDPELGPLQVCQVCGYTVEGEAPDRCPICNVGKERFQAFK